jgi:hypothetical protein
MYLNFLWLYLNKYNRTCILLNVYKYPEKYNNDDDEDDDAIKIMSIIRILQSKSRENNILIAYKMHYAIYDDVIFIMMLHI